MSQKIDVKVITPRSGNKKPSTMAPNDRANPRNRIYVRAMQGTFQRLRKVMGWGLMVLFLGLPWIPYGDRQGILLDIGHQQFHIFGLTIWPQDLTLLAWLLMLSAFALFFFTTFLGRVWCGYTCPQTVWTFLFIWFEEKLEGAANKRRKLDQQPLTLDRAWRKGLKHLGWWAVSLLTALTFVAYFVPARALVSDFFTASAGFWPTFWVLFFAVCTYANAGWMRSIMCTHICPYARFQSVMFDKDTYIVGYSVERGEPRGPRSRKQDHKALGLGDCIDCDLCVQVCPTGIDIRNGLQYECINCGACIDACDQTMERMGYPKGLISYTTEHKLAGGRTHVARPKLIGYGLLLLLFCGLFIYTLAVRMPMGLDVIRDRNALYRETSEGLIENSYTLKILNKSQHSQNYRLSVSGLDGVEWIGPTEVTVAAGEVFAQPISLSVDPYLLKQPITDIEFVLRRQGVSGSKAEVHQASRFIGRL